MPNYVWVLIVLGVGVLVAWTSFCLHLFEVKLFRAPKIWRELQDFREAEAVKREALVQELIAEHNRLILIDMSLNSPHWGEYAAQQMIAQVRSHDRRNHR